VPFDITVCAVQELIKHTEDPQEKERLEVAHDEMKVTANFHC